MSNKVLNNNKNKTKNFVRFNFLLFALIKSLEIQEKNRKFYCNLYNFHKLTNFISNGLEYLN